jgi:putative acetyltransferase
LTIRAENKTDREAVRAVNEAAFATPSEADLVDTLRRRADPLVSLVAVEEGEIVGHILFSPVSLSGHPELKIMGLAPMSVLPGCQRKGTGSELVRGGLERCIQMGFEAVVVLGHPGYYPRFGFRSASEFGIDSDYEVPDDAFMALELSPGALSGKTGTARYHPAFREQ